MEESHEGGTSFHTIASQPVSVTFHDLRFGATMRGRAAKAWAEGSGQEDELQKDGLCGGVSCTKPILNGLTGAFLPGKMTAIMGASGAGKTTLLKAIAGEGAEGVLTGDLQVNGSRVTTDDIRRISGFVFQDDLLMATMTVREAILFSARLRLPRSMSLAHKTLRVQQVIELLHLTNCADTVIGSALAKGGISGGEKKRTAIGMELITNPSILFLDEPTTGLDTYTAYSVMHTLHSLARAGRTVIATIHQPSSDTFGLFDNLAVLSQGHLVYQGPAQGMVHYAAEMGKRCGEFVNPADFLFMEVLNDRDDLVGGGDEAIVTARTNKLLAAYRRSSVCQEYLRDALSCRTLKGPPLDLHTREDRPGIGEQMAILALRNVRNMVRNPMGLRAKLLQSVFLGLVVSAIFYDIGDNQSSTQDRMGSLFFMAMTMMNGAFSVLSLFGQERQIVEREQALSLYSVKAYFVPKIVTELPQNILGPLLQGTIVFFCLGYHRTFVQTMFQKYLIFVTTVIVTTNSGNGLGIFIACLFSDLRYPASRTSPTPEAVPVCHCSSFFCSQSLSFFSWPCLVWPLSLLSWWFRCVRCLSQPQQPHTGALTLWSSTRRARRLTRQLLRLMHAEISGVM
mmetsp:Transcript_94503/g.137985  ORF Transcript_94503/g.137985 Transcript_94503/m.137985 type:complete len:623 (+) Transcript_94503:57-1925(+)